MSHREIRDFSEHLRMLDYPNSMTLNSANNGGFTALAALLQWLVGRVEFGATISGDPSNEAGRVQLIRSAVEFMATKAGIKLNPRRLYGCGGGAAKELLKITTMLVSAPRIMDDSYTENLSSMDIDLTDKVEELRTARTLSSELTSRGAVLYDLLAKEKDNKDLRIQHSTRTLELSVVEEGLKSAVGQLKQELIQSQTALAAAKAESVSLLNKISRKESECSRANQRLASLTKVRPAFLDELERLEVELSGLYEKYVLLVRCQAALKAQVHSIEEIDDISNVAAISQKHSKLLMGPNKGQVIPSGYDIDSDDDDDSDLDDLDDSVDDIDNARKMAAMSIAGGKPRAKTRLRVRTGAGVDRGRVFGGMGPPGQIGEEDDSIGNSSDSLLGLGHDGTDGGVTDEGDSIRFDDMGKPLGPDVPDVSDEDF